jgi:transposase
MFEEEFAKLPVEPPRRVESLPGSYGLDAYPIRAGTICEDARGRWYLNACVAVPVAEPRSSAHNRRKDSLHQFSTRLVRGYDTIFVGNVNASALVKTPHAKSVLDASWSAFRTMLRYKGDFAGATSAEVDEAFSTQTCSACDARSGPKGIAGLGIRAWVCSKCGAVHDRNVNAAKNILAAGRRRLAEGIPALDGAGGRQS